MFSSRHSSSSQNRTSSHSAKIKPGCFPTISALNTSQKPGVASYKIYAIHGLNSSIDTWKAREGYEWLKHLSTWLKANGGHRCDISLVGWNSHVISASNISTQIRSDVRQLAGTIMKQSGEKNDIRPSRSQPGLKQSVIIIGHSMGGILARALLGWMHAEGEYSDFLSRVAGVILLASPSEGSALANYAKPFTSGLRSVSPGMSLLLNASQLKGLQPGSQELAEVGESFAIFASSRSGRIGVAPLMVACLKETAREKGIVQVVSDRSADVPRQAAGYVRWETNRLEGLSHTQVTRFTQQEAMNNNDNLRKIVKEFLWMQGVSRNFDQINLRVSSR